MNSIKFSFDNGEHRRVSFPANPLTATFCINGSTIYERDYCEHGIGEQEDNADEDEEETDESRLASLEALRYALHHAPFCKNMHTLMSIPNEAYYEMQGIPTKCAIRVEQLYYGHILDDVNIEVPKGKIYALLGSSNNGKSILLKCIIGRLKPCSGRIETFGSFPASSPLSAICVGYMPQEMALHPELTVEQTLFHYGRLYQLPLFLILERVRFLYSMFNLPDQNLLIRELNPGQKWRMSLAVALIHSPPLLLLDEPTVNVDPLIRSSVWSKLERICDEEGLTILVTTKYPEEIGYAYKVGLMRNGHVYMENSPDELRQYYRCDTYDQLYTKFCMSNVPRRMRSSIGPFMMPSNQGRPRLSLDTSFYSATTSRSGESSFATTKFDNSNQETIHSNQDTTKSMFPLLDTLTSSEPDRSSNGDEAHSRSSNFELSERPNLPMAEWPICESRRTAYISRFINLDMKRLLTLVMKNFYVILGNSMLILLFYFIFPALQIVFVCYIFGRTATNLPASIPMDVAMFNHNFTTSFVNRFLDNRLFRLNYTATIDDSVEQVHRGRSWVSVVPWSIVNSSQFNSSETLCTELAALAQVSQVSLFGVKLYLDNSNYLINQQMMYSFINSMRRFMQSDCLSTLFTNCPEVTGLGRKRSAIEIEEVIYGNTNFGFLEFLLPGFLVCLAFAYSLVLTAYLFIKEHVAGLQDRCLTTGTSGIEVLSSHLISQTKIFILQETILLMIVLRLFGLPSRGPLYALWLLIFLQGIVGISFGLFIAVICPAPLGAALFTSGVFIPAFFMSGIVWPIESMSKVIRNISHLLPLTLPINAVRYIISRGPDIRYSQILLGFTVSTMYIVILLLLTIIIFKYKTSS